MSIQNLIYIQKEITKKYSNDLVPIREDWGVYKYNFGVFHDDRFSVKYDKKTDKVILETTYSNQKVDEAFLEQMNFILNILKN